MCKKSFSTQGRFGTDELMNVCFFIFKVKDVTAAAIKNVQSTSTNLRRYERSLNVLFSVKKSNDCL